MIDPAQHHGASTARHFRRLYLVALSLIAALAIGGQLLVQHSLTSQRGDGHLVNKAGYQRMLSQRITLKLMLHEPGPAAADDAAAIATMRDRWLAAHEELAQEVERIAFDEAARRELTRRFAAAEQPLRRISELVTTLAEAGALSSADRTALMHDQELFLPLMDAVVLGFEQSLQARVSFLQRVELTLLALTLLTLALEAVLIFRPAVRRLQSSLDELELRNRQATRRLESLRHLAGGIAHSFNNLLTGILGHAELERYEALHRGRNTEYIDAQIRGCRRAAEIVTQLVAYSGHGYYRCEPVGLGPWLTELTDAFPVIVPGIALTAELKDTPVAAVDRAALKQAIEGILVNACEAMKGRTGGVTVRLSQALLTGSKLTSGPYRTELPAGLYASIEIIDEGKGIAPEDLERIFDPYYTSKEFGRGLGLAAILGIVHGHDGGIVVDSVPGRGSTVRLYLPVAGQETAPAPTPKRGLLRRRPR